MISPILELPGIRDQTLIVLVDAAMRRQATVRRMHQAPLWRVCGTRPRHSAICRFVVSPIWWVHHGSRSSHYDSGIYGLLAKFAGARGDSADRAAAVADRRDPAHVDAGELPTAVRDPVSPRPGVIFPLRPGALGSSGRPARWRTGRF